MLFEGDGLETDHRYFTNLRDTEFRPDITKWCETTYTRAKSLLDEDFPARFRRETPQRMSELFFAAAFLDAGWEPIARIPPFDFAFAMGSGRLLVEVTTPDPHSSTTWREKKGDGYKVWSADEKTEDAELRMLTGSFNSKAGKIKDHLDKAQITKADYVVIALSGLRLNRETPRAPDIGGPMPSFAKAFLPVGSQYVTILLGEGSGKPTDSGWQPKETIDQEGRTTVARDAFLRPEFQFIDAVAYTPLHFGEPISPIAECAALHNPMARTKDQAIRLGLGLEYAVEVRKGDFSIGPL